MAKDLVDPLRITLPKEGKESMGVGGWIRAERDALESFRMGWGSQPNPGGMRTGRPVMLSQTEQIDDDHLCPR